MICAGRSSSALKETLVKYCESKPCVRTDWSSFMGSCTLPVACGTQGGSNIGTQGMPRIGEGRVKLMLGGGI